MEPDIEEVDEVLNTCSEAFDNGSRYPGMSYEQGVQDAILWMQGHGDHPFSED